MGKFLENPKYQAVKDTGKVLFWKHGIKRVSIEEICREAKVSKMTFYKFFPNKIELAKYLLIEIIDASLNDFKKVLDSDLSFTEKVQKMFLIKMEAAKGFSVEFINDVYKFPETGIPAIMEEKGNVSLQLFVNFFLESQQKSLIRKDVKIEFIMHYFNQMAQIFENAALVDKYQTPQDLILESMNFLFHGIVNNGH